jgi:hypothetical protein
MRLRAAAESSSDPDRDDKDGNTEPISVSVATKVCKFTLAVHSLCLTLSKSRDPLHLLLDYVAEVSAQTAA